MADFRSMVDHFIRVQGFVRNSDLAGWFHISRQRVSFRLGQMIEREELVRHGHGRGARYTPGRGWAEGPLGVTQGTAPDAMWELMAERYPDFGYVALALGEKRHYLRRSDALAILSGVRRLFVVVDFAGVASASRAFLDTLLGPCPPGGGFVAAVNMPPQIAAVTQARAAALARGFKPPRQDLTFGSSPRAVRLLCPACTAEGELPGQ
jgi:hypothetical protein